MVLSHAWDHKESDTTERLTLSLFFFHFSYHMLPELKIILHFKRREHTYTFLSESRTDFFKHIYGMNPSTN